MVAVKEYHIPLVLPASKYQCPGPCGCLRNYLREYLTLLLHQEDPNLEVEELTLNIRDESKNFIVYEIRAKVTYPRECKNMLEYQDVIQKIDWAMKRFTAFIRKFGDSETANWMARATEDDKNP